MKFESDKERRRAKWNRKNTYKNKNKSRFFKEPKHNNGLSNEDKFEEKELDNDYDL
jgi:hypothetical protein